MSIGNIDIHPRPSLSQVIELLEQAELPTVDIQEQHLEHFFIAKLNNHPIGVIGLEIHHPYGLLRSLVVAPQGRGKGIAAALVEHLESHAKNLGIRILFLLTNTAESYFPRLGYELCDRSSAPDAIKGTVEFRELCPANSALMAKEML